MLGYSEKIKTNTLTFEKLSPDVKMNLEEVAGINLLNSNLFSFLSATMVGSKGGIA